jgi:four helix bundle protein
MQIRRFQELICWQLARELERKVFAFTAVMPASHDPDFCREIRRPAAAATRNMAEGFGRFWPAEFANKLRIAIGELQEVQDDLDKALDKKYVTEANHSSMFRLADRSIGASVNLVKYLEIAGPDWKKNFRANMQKQRERRTHREPGTRDGNPEPGTRSLISQSHLNLVAHDPRLVPRDADARILNHRARRDVVLPPVPRARDDAAGDRSFGKRTAAVQADVVDGMEGAVEIEERNPAIADGDLAALAGRNVADARDRDEIVQGPSKLGPYFPFAIGFLPLTHSFHPPSSALTRLTPRSCSMSAARALVASSRQAQ